MDVWASLADERRATADLLAGLTDEQWSRPSLCSAWTVKDVAVHLVPSTGEGLSEFVWATVRARGNIHRASESLDFLVSKRARRGFVKRGLPELTLRASDLDWTHGTGPEVTGPADALGLALCGRSAWLDHLSGPGRESLATWVG